MKWFQHQSDASDDIKIKRLEHKFGLQGYAIYFKILEKVAKEGKNHRLLLKKFPTDFLAENFGAKKELIEECLTFMNEISLITFKNEEIYVPTMKKYMDEWSRRTPKLLRSNSRVTTEQLPKDKNRIDKIRIEESTPFVFNKNLPAPSNVKCTYNGKDMRFVAAKNKWFVIEHGEWMEWAGKKEDESNIVCSVK